MLVAAAVIAALLAFDTGADRAAPAAGAVLPGTMLPATAPPAIGGASSAEAAPLLLRAETTANLYAAPDRAAEVVAVLPAGREAELLGKTRDGGWLHVAYPPASLDRGWVRASSMPLDAAVLAGVETVAALPTTTEVAAAAEPDDALPDLTIVDAFLLQDGRIAVAIRNIGDGEIVDRMVSLHVAKVEGDILGVLRIGPTTLLPAASATVVTPVVVVEPGSYRLELDVGDEIAERHERNNTHVALLIPAS